MIHKFFFDERQILCYVILIQLVILYPNALESLNTGMLSIILYVWFSILLYLVSINNLHCYA